MWVTVEHEVIAPFCGTMAKFDLAVRGSSEQLSTTVEGNDHEVERGPDLLGMSF